MQINLNLLLVKDILKNIYIINWHNILYMKNLLKLNGLTIFNGLIIYKNYIVNYIVNKYFTL